MRIPAPLKKYQLTYVGAGKITHSVQIRAKSKNSWTPNKYGVIG